MFVKRPPLVRIAVTRTVCLYSFSIAVVQHIVIMTSFFLTHIHYSGGGGAGGTGVVKKINGCFLKIVHEKFRAKNADSEMFSEQMVDLTAMNPELRQMNIKSTELLTPEKVRE